MKNILFLILMLAFSSLAAPKCFDKYVGAANKAEKEHIRAKANYAKQSLNYVYKFDVINVFPFFCLNNDTIEQSLSKQGRIVYLCSFESNIRTYEDNLGNTHVQIVILSYVQPVRGNPDTMTYTMYFLKFNKDTNTWDKEKESLVAVLKKSDNLSGCYKCQK